MSVRSRRGISIRPSSIYFLGILGFATIVCQPATASAQGFFEQLFGGFQASPALQTPPPQAQAYANPRDLPPRMPVQQLPVGAGQSVAYCVRLCDGRFFPVPHLNAATPIQQCNALCPASQTRIFLGSEIGGSVAADGSRYTALPSAFVYRMRLVPNCTCNGRDGFGLARVDIKTDSTLRTGDIVATDSGPNGITSPKSKHHGVPTAKTTAH